MDKFLQFHCIENQLLVKFNMAVNSLGYRTTYLMITAQSLKVRNIAFKIKDELSCSDTLWSKRKNLTSISTNRVEIT